MCCMCYAPYLFNYSSTCMHSLTFVAVLVCLCNHSVKCPKKQVFTHSLHDTVTSWHCQKTAEVLFYILLHFLY